MTPNYFGRVGGAESGNNDNAKNPVGTASGRFQFLDSTYLGLARKLYPGVPDAQLMAQKNNPDVQRNVMQAYTDDSSKHLTANGFDANDGNLYLAHFFGAKGATDVLKADPNTPVRSIIGDKAIEANPFLANFTAGDAVKWTQAKMNGSPAPGGSMNTQPQGQQQPQNTDYKDSVLQGGPMALFGMGQNGYDWGNSLIGAGSAIAGINSPQQAAAIAQLKTDPGKDIASQYDTNTGTWYHYNKRTGQTTNQQDPNFLQNRIATAAALEKAKSDNRGPLEKTVENFNKNRQLLDSNQDLTDDLISLREYLDQHPEAGGWMNRYKSLGTSAINGSGLFSDDFKKKLAENGLYSTPEQSEFFGKLERVQQRLIANEQLKQKGTQTEGDAIRYGKASFDSMTKLDGDALKHALDDKIKGNLTDYSTTYGAYKGTADRYAGDTRFSGDNAMVEKYAAKNDDYSKRLKQIEADIANRKAAPPAAAPGTPGATDTRPPLGSIPGAPGSAPAAPQQPPQAPQPSAVVPGTVRRVPAIPEGTSLIGPTTLPNGKPGFKKADGTLYDSAGRPYQQ